MPFLIAAMFLGPVHAATPEAQASFAQGRAAFERNDFAGAQSHYEQALAQGMDGPAVHYNIGVAAFRNRDFVRARRAFEEVARTPAMAGLAHYNLGLIAVERNDEAAARKHFQRVSRETSDERLNGLAARQLAQLPAEPPPLEWSVYGRAGFGIDDNVALRSESVDTAGTGEDDNFAELLLAASANFAQHWRADAAVAMLNYADLDDFDQGAFSLGASRAVPLAGWTLEPGAVMNQLSLGGDVYERSAALGVRAIRDFGGRRLQADLRATSVDGKGDFAGLSGSRFELGARFDWSWQAWEFGLHGRAEDNDSDDAIFATRWFELGGSALYAISPRWSVLGGTTLRRTKHPEIPDVEDSRDDRRTTLRLGAIARYWRSAQVFVRVEHERNDSPIEAYEYDRNWIAASLEAWY